MIISQKHNKCLLVPTLSHRETRLETLLSVQPYKNEFDKIIISINGSDKKQALEDIRKSRLCVHPGLIVLYTNRLLSSLDHARFWAARLANTLSPSDYIMLLADDDLLTSNCDIGDYFAQIIRRDPAIGAGRYIFKGDERKFPVAPQAIHPGETLTALDVLLRDPKGNHFINISGMIAPLSVIADVTIFSSLLRSGGWRFESMLMTHRDTINIYAPPNPCVEVRFHSGQESARLTLANNPYNEVPYLVWVWLNQPSTRPWHNNHSVYGFTFRRLLHYLRRTLIYFLYSVNRRNNL